MALILNEEQQMLRDSAKSFIEERSPVSALRERRDRGEEWSPELWQGMAEMGWAGMVIPEAYGGLEFGYVGAGLVMEECGRVLASSPLLSSSFVCASLIASLGNDEQKETLLPAIASGASIFSLAANESDRFDPTSTTLTAKQDGDGFVLNGTKRHVLDGQVASTFIVAAKTAGNSDEISLFVVAGDTPGVTVEAIRNADMRLVTSMQFDGVRVREEDQLGAADTGWPALERALDIGAVLSAAELSGVAQEAFERTLEYLKERKQFGVFVGSFQALQHRAAQLFCELELCKSAILKAEQAIDEDLPERSRLASMAKAKTAKTAKLAVNEAVQMFSGIGMTDEFDIGFFMKRAAGACQEFGDYYYHADRFARLGGY